MPKADSRDIEQILARLAKSKADTDAWKLLYLRMWPFVFGVNFRLLGGIRQSAEDLSQEVFVRLLQYSSFEKLQDSDSLHRYLRQVCLNVTRDYVQQSARRKEEGLTEDELGVFKSQMIRLDESIINEEYRRLLSTLGDDDRQIIEMAIVGYSLHEIASMAGISYNNAAVRLHRIRQNLKKTSEQIKRRR